MFFRTCRIPPISSPARRRCRRRFHCIRSSTFATIDRGAILAVRRWPAGPAQAGRIVDPDPWYVGWADDDPPVSREPTTNVTHAQGLYRKVCTFANNIINAHNPGASRYRHLESHSLEHTDAHDADLVARWRIAMRVARLTVGAFYQHVGYFSDLVPNPADAEADFVNWRVRLLEITDLADRICRTCGRGDYWLRDFADHLNLAAWTREADTITTSPHQADLRIMRLPEIDWTVPNDIMPAATSLATWGASGVLDEHGAFVDPEKVDADTRGGMRHMIRSFNEALQRYDRDPASRM